MEGLSRAEAIENYRYDILRKIELKELVKKDFEELKGKKLGCFCKPYKDCHGDVLAEIANNIDKYFK